ncbi:MAG: hypothetical protein QM778_25130 [Myxococcales bacterium]
MQRCVTHLFCLGALGGCLGPLASDKPGYSRYVLPPDARVQAARDDYEANHKVDMNDGLEAGPIPLKSGFADGQGVKYWDLGVAKGTIAPTYFLTRCGEHRAPLPGGALDHPWLSDAIPGAPDYTPFRALYAVCVTDDYAGEIIASTAALSDAIDLGLVREPNDPTEWLDVHMVALGEMPGPGLSGRQVYVDDLLFDCVSSEPQEGRFPFVDKRIAAKNVYELSFEGSMKIERVVFAQALIGADGQRNPSYAPAWKVIAVTMKAGTDLTLFDRESALVTLDDKGTPKPAAPEVVSAKASGNTVNRPQQLPSVEVP